MIFFLASKFFHEPQWQQKDTCPVKYIFRASGEKGKQCQEVNCNFFAPCLSSINTEQDLWISQTPL